jgi:hypothetical protein
LDRDGPKAGVVAFERMQTQARRIDVLDPSRLIEQCQGEPQPSGETDWCADEAHQRNLRRQA